MERGTPTGSVSAVYSRATHFMYNISIQMFRKYTEVVCCVRSWPRCQISGIPLGAARYQLSIEVNHFLICQTFYI